MFDLFNKLMDRLFDEDVDEYDKVQDATSRVEEIDSDEWGDVYDSLSDLGKEAMDAFSHDFDDGAIDDSGLWRRGTDFED